MGTTLLLADDSITIQKVVGIIFANEDYELVVVDNGNSALEKAREIRPDVMLVDALMPGKSGYEVCEEVRRDPALKDISLLLLVGAFEPFDEDKARLSGADDHITKPFESQSLIDKVKALVVLASSRTPEPPPVQDAVQQSFVPVAPLEKSVPETFEVPIAASPSESSPETSDTSAKLFDSFRGFVHLGSDAARPAAENVSLPPDVPEPAERVEPEGVILLSSVDIVEAAPEDDPWGTFTDVVEEGEEIHFGEVLEESPDEQQDFSDTVEEIEPYALLEEEDSLGSFGAVSLQDEPDVSGEMGIPLAEELSFADESGEGDVTDFVEEVSVLTTSDSGSISLGDFSPVSQTVMLAETVVAEPHEAQTTELFGFSPDYTDLPFAQEEDFLPAAEVFPDVEAGLPSSAVPGAEGVVTLTEEQLAAAISKISREIIEKIAWEVVPDLAESLIKEEIRKIKEGMGR